LPVEKREEQNASILKRLEKVADGQDDETWSTSRLIWRAGELNVVEAVPYLLKLSDREDLLKEYSLVWTLGRLSDQQALSFLEKTHHTNLKTKQENILLNITREALINTYSEKDLTKFNEELIETLPNGFRDIMNTNEETIINWLNEHCIKNQKTNDILNIQSGRVS